MQGWLVHLMIHSEPKHIPVGVGVSEPWHHSSALLFLESASSLLSAAVVYLSERCCVLSFKVGCTETPRCCSSHVNMSHAVLNVRRPETRRRLSALTSRVFKLSISRLLFLTTIYSHLCLGQSRVLHCELRGLSAGKYQPQQQTGTHLFFNHILNI